MPEQLPGLMGRIGLALGMIGLWVAALLAIYRQALTAQNAVNLLYRSLQALGRLPARLDQGLRDRMRRLFFRPRGAVLPAEVRKELERVMLAREHALEEDGGVMIVPNEYEVELHPDVYQRHYREAEKELASQWSRWLVDLLATSNHRYGEKRYRFWGPVGVKIREAADLAEHQVRVQGRINAGTEPAPGQVVGAAVPAPPARPQPARPAATALLPSPVAGCLELLPGGRRWSLRSGTSTMGRSEDNDIHLDMAHVQRKRLISGRHAYLRCERDRCYLFDGTPDGRRSTNGTFVNGRPVAAGGHELRDGDVVVLASLDPDNPRPDTPGVVALMFHGRCP